MVFATTIIGDLLSFPELSDSEIALMDGFVRMTERGTNLSEREP